MNLTCCDCHDESSLKEKVIIKSDFDTSNLTKNSQAKFQQSFSSSLSNVQSFIHLIVITYRQALYTFTRFHHTILDFIFRNHYVDQLNTISCDVNNRKFINHKITDVPEHLRFNPFILDGYRSTLDLKQSLLSLFYIHNESTNIHSHAFAFIYFLFFMSKNLPWNQIHSNHLCLFFAFCHVFSTIAPWFGSTIYHLFMNHKGGQIVYNRLLAFDVLGIWITQALGALLPVYMSVIDFNFTFKYLYLTIYVLLAVRSLYDVLIVGGRMRRRFGFSSLVLMRFISIYLRTYSTNKITNYDDLILQELYPILGALISAYRIPEIFSPGTFDLFLNSHNLMHFLVVLATFHLHSSAVSDLFLLLKY